MALLAMFSLTSCEILGGDNITPDNNQTEQPDNGDENKNPDNGDENQDPDNPTQHKIYVYNAIDWEPLYIYMWRWEGEQVTEYVGAWCGAIVEQTEIINGHTYYVYDLPTDANGKEIGVIFNDSNGTQTSDWYITIDKDYYVLLSEATTPSIIEDKNNPTGGNNNDDPVTPPVDEVPETQKIYYTSTDGGIVEPNNEGVDYFGANIISNTYENGKGVITFDGDVTLIGDMAFCNCFTLNSITIPNSVTSIGYWAFSGCRNLTNFTIPNSVIEILEGAFRYCLALTDVNIGNGITSIGYGAFLSCESLSSITIPDNVIMIGSDAFKDCSNLTNVALGKGVANIGWSAFDGCNIDTMIINGKFIEEDMPYEGVLNWYTNARIKNIIIDDNVTRIGNYALCVDYQFGVGGSYTSIQNVVISDTVTSIGEGAFSRSLDLANVTIGKGVEKIDEFAFFGCSSLTNINIPGNGTTTIEFWAFHNCTSLESATIGNGVISIGEQAFESCSSLKCVIIGESVTSIGEVAFEDCVSLTEVYCKATTPPTIKYEDWIGGPFPFNEGMNIYVPKEYYNIYKYVPSAYEEANLWLLYEEYIKPYDFAE